MKLVKVMNIPGSYLITVYDRNENGIGQIIARKNFTISQDEYPFDLSSNNEDLLIEIEPFQNEIFQWLLNRKNSKLEL
jgi:hypothetical protein